MNAILLAGAALVGLPILLHLIMKQEPKRLPFPAFRFLKQRLKTNQRKLRLRHWLLLLLRMLLIALFCLTLYQPSVLSSGLLDFGRPIAVVLVIDTSPGMGYAEGNKTNLEEACSRAAELINDLPDGSRIAIVETGDPGGDWLPSASDARTKLSDIAKKAPKPGQHSTTGGSAQSVSASLVHAYQLLKTVDEQSDTQGETLPRLVAIFTDRAASSWDASRVEDLKKLRDAVPPPAVAHAVVDVGTEKPVNVALLNAEMHDGRPQQVPANQPVAVTVTVASTGLDVRPVVLAVLDDGRPLRKEVEVKDGQTQSLTFDFRDLKPGLHQLRFELENADALMADNRRYFTFRVAEPRRVLAIADESGDPENGNYGDAHFWRLAINANREFACDVVKTDAVPELAQYEAVTLLSAARPDAALWEKLQKYVEAGGQLIVAPPGEDRLVLDSYNGEAATKVLPGAFKDKPVDVTLLPENNPRRRGVAWSVLTRNDAETDRELQHPMLAPIKGWKAKPDVDVIRNPRKAYRYWLVEPRGGGRTVATYDTDDDVKKRDPAVLERTLGKGRVLLLTTKVEPPSDADWNDYWSPGNSWIVAFPDLMLRYAAGSAADVNFNHPVGTTVTVPLAKLLAGRRDNLSLNGLGIAGTDALLRIGERQTDVRIGPPRTDSAGSLKITAANPPPGSPAYEEGFSLNVPAEESMLDKAPVEGIEALTGEGTVIPVGKNVPLAEMLEKSPISQRPVDLFPWLLIAVLLLIVVENLLSNRFYRRPKST